MPHRTFNPVLTSAILALLAGVFTSGAYAAGSPQASPAQTGPSSGKAVAAGAVEDSLAACLARIPKDASVGQRLIAEQSCRRDDGDRQPVKASGGR
jgi:hypothetical protein